MELKNINSLENFDDIDNENKNRETHNPKVNFQVLVSTSIKPSNQLKSFAKEFSIILRNAMRINRGSRAVKDILEAANSQGFTDLIILHEHRGTPTGLVLSHMRHGPTAYFGLYNVIPRHQIGTRKDLGTIPEKYPNLIFEGFDTNVGNRTKNILKYIFPYSQKGAKSVISFVNRAGYINFRYHSFEEKKKHTVNLIEIGPRFQMMLYKIKIGGVDSRFSELDWIYRPFIRCWKKRRN
jgi:U3 small nucleolar ribonucleoprotein protein IMP4